MKAMVKVMVLSRGAITLKDLQNMSGKEIEEWRKLLRAYWGKHTNGYGGFIL